MAAALSAITDSVHFAQTDLVNWTLVADDTGVILIDAGFPGSRDDVLASLRHLGFGVDDLRAILLTHAHIDHFGSAIWFAKTHGTPVYCHADEVGHAKREYLEQASPVDVAAHALAAALAEVVGGDQPQGGVHARRHPDRAGADRGRRRRTARRADGHPQPRDTRAGTARSSSTACWSAATRW